LAAVGNDGYARGVPLLRTALDALEADDAAGGQGLAVLWLGARAAMNVWDDVRFATLSRRLVGAAREHGLIGALPSALSSLTAVALLVGDYAQAGAMIAEAETLTTRRVGAGSFHGAMALAAWQGREEAYNIASNAAEALDGPGPGGVLDIVTSYTEALLYNGLGRYEQALPAARRGAEHAGDLSYALWALPELVEAASRCDEPALAYEAAEILATTTGPADTHWSRGMEARCWALCLDGEAAELAYQTSLMELAQTRFATQLARTHLVYGEWLRRQRRRIDARDQLRRAQELLATIGADGFAARAERELAATGERARPRRAESATDLTPQETQIARLAADGLANAEIAAQLFISGRTVEYHLHKVFIKLGITSRTQLNRALGSSPRI
jgi:DNA-binding CsgD family transcriptional regulator